MDERLSSLAATLAHLVGVTVLPWDLVPNAVRQLAIKADLACRVLFEDQMAAKLQKWARDKRRKYMWELGMKQRHYKKCAAMFSKYKRHPFDLDIRQEALALSEHRLTPPDHSLKTLWKIFEEEHVSAGLMQRQYRRLCAARRIAAMKVGVSLMSTTEWKHA